MLQAGHNIKANDLLDLLKDSESRQYLTGILLEDDVPDEVRERVWKDCLMLLRCEMLNKRITDKSALMSQYEKQGEVSRSRAIMAEIQELVREKQSLVTSL